MIEVGSETPIGVAAEGHPTSVRHFFEAIATRLSPNILSALPEGVRIAVAVSGPQGGEWTLERRETDVRVIEGIERGNDCLMRCSADDFEQLLRGEQNGVRYFLAGRLHVEGDVGLALALQQVIAPASAS